ncbi:hypothetical protein FK268_17890 [Tsukamurella sputi]|uniref:Uncharacterized protein n=1 Tax=Tsukamurella sputi TaxID=2591848 RepID=A0A5C5RLA5_9ACTN|nr:hypothetical protein [Tsukamurella sputi]TWS22875.1 hypothetical protein FK268_17890 [Tsukamurella sputi]
MTDNTSVPTPSRRSWYAAAGFAALTLVGSLLFPTTSSPASADPGGLPPTTRVPYPTDGSLPPWTLPGGYTWCSAMSGPGYDQGAVYVQPGYECPPTGVPTTSSSTPPTSTTSASPTPRIGGNPPNLPQAPNPPFAGVGAPNGKSWDYGVDTLGPPAGGRTTTAAAPR